MKIDLWAEPLPRLQLADCFNALLTQDGVLPDPAKLTPAVVLALREQMLATLADARNAGSLPDESATLITLSTLAFVTGDPAEAARLSEQALHVARTLLGSPLIGHALCNLGNARLAQGDRAAAKQHFVEALKSARAHRDRLSETLVLLNLGQVYEAEGQWPLARLRFREADGVAQRAQLRDIQHAIQIRLGRVAEALGELSVAACHYWTAVAEAQRIGDWTVEAAARHALGVVYEAQGESAAASLAWAKLARRAGIEGDVQALLFSRLAQARFFSSQSESLPIARRFSEDALELARRMKDRLAEGVALGWLAHVRYLQGDVAAARKRYLRRMTLAQNAQDWEADGRTNYNLAVLEASCQRWELARAHAADALKIFDYHDATEARDRAQELGMAIYHESPPDKVKSEVVPAA
jgi:tetratricopeptide (TPR) repeat protein